jgi:preprotein translocase subunit YajC
MNPTPFVVALAGSPNSAEPHPLSSLLLMGTVFAIFWFVLILPMRNKQKKLEQVVKGLKAGDRIVINPGILGTIVAVEDDAFLVRVDEKTKLKVLKGAVAGLQATSPETEKK